MDKLFRQESKFTWGAERPGDLPPANLPEVAFAGRSNVGKSSLINALLDRKNLVRTSSTPGQTRALNFFDVGGNFMLVDMPGYGYAKASKGDQKTWSMLLRSYLKGRQTLRLVCVLVDARHGLKDNDQDMLKLLSSAAVPVRIVLTKTDELEEGDAEKLLAKILPALKKHPCVHPSPILTSSHGQQGIGDLRAAIVETLGLSVPG